MTEPVAIELIQQKDCGDCAVACLAMLLGRAYEEILASISPRCKPTQKGLTIAQLRRTAKLLGHSLKWRAFIEDEDIKKQGEPEIGILYLLRKNKSSGHSVMYFKGAVYDPADGLFYTDLDAFLGYERWVVDGLLWREK